MSFIQKLKNKFKQDNEEEVSTKYKEGMEKTRKSFTFYLNERNIVWQVLITFLFSRWFI